MTASAKVRCSGQLHRISVTVGGALVLHDHDEEITRAYVALGGEKCRCLDVLEAWRQRDRAKLPAPLRPALDAARKAAAERKSLIPTGGDPLEQSMAYRARQRVIDAARKALDDCDYRRSRSAWAGGDHSLSVHVADEPHISGQSDRVWSDNGKWSGTDSHISAAVRLSWHRRVYRRGMAIVDGCLVLDIIDEDDKSITVLAGKQGRGFAVHPRRAKVITSSDGSLRLRWIKDREVA